MRPGPLGSSPTAIDPSTVYTARSSGSTGSGSSLPAGIATST